MDWAGLIPYVDFFSLMAYDCECHSKRTAAAAAVKRRRLLEHRVLLICAVPPSCRCALLRPQGGRTCNLAVTCCSQCVFLSRFPTPVVLQFMEAGRWQQTTTLLGKMRWWVDLAAGQQWWGGEGAAAPVALRALFPLAPSSSPGHLPMMRCIPNLLRLSRVANQLPCQGQGAAPRFVTAIQLCCTCVLRACAGRHT